MQNTTGRLNIVIAAGGTGGHLFPAQALALELLEKHPEMKITFVGAGLRKNGYFNREVFHYLDIKSGTPFKKHPLKVLKALLHLLQGTLSCFSFFSKKKPDVIVGFGSFHTFPAILAAKIRSVPIVLFESNAFPGKVNRYCSKWAKVSAVQFSHAHEYFRSKSVCVHMPFTKRKKVTRREALRYYGIGEEKFTLLVFGGSQGAEAINRFFCEAVQKLVKEKIDFQVIHIIGSKKRGEKLQDYYTKMDVHACVKVFEEKMEYAWTAADLSISRSGAATLAECTEFSVPSILIPYPYGTENHQQKNAAFLTDEVKGAIFLEEEELGGETLASNVLNLVADKRKKLKEMQKNLLLYRKKEIKQELCSVVLQSL